MAKFELFSRRLRKSRGEVSDVYTYDDIPSALRVQIVQIWQEAFGAPDVAWAQICHVLKAFGEIHAILCKEYGRFQLVEDANDTFTAVANFFLRLKSAEEALDVIEVTFLMIDTVVRDTPYQFGGASVSPDAAIAELNDRFRQHAVGYSFEAGRIVRIDSQFIHSEAVKPVLVLLHGKRFSGANQEFLRAHEHYRAGRFQESINECLKAFESTMKAICMKQHWPISSNDTASALIKACFENQLIPPYLESQFSSVRAVLQSGIPTVRNRTSGHGQGTNPVAIPMHFASYLLHLTASTILFLVESEKELSSKQ